MPGLQGFEPQQTKIAQPQTTNAPAAAMAAQQMQTLSARLSNFSKEMYSNHADVVADKAKDAALKDSAEGKPYHKEAVYTVYGKAYNNTLSATYASNAEIAIAKQAKSLAITHDNDPVGFSNSMDEFVNGLVKEAPTPELKTVIGIGGKKTALAGYGVLAKEEHNRIKAYQQETFVQAWDLAIPQIVDMHHAGKTADADVMQQAKLTQLDAMVASGDIDEATKEKLIKDATFKINYGVSMLHMGSLLDGGKIDQAKSYLESQVLTSRKDMGEGENKKHKADLIKMMKTFETKQKAHATAQGKQANLLLGDATTIMGKGKSPDNLEELQAIYPFASEAQQHKFDVRIKAFEILNAFRGKSTTELEAELTKYKTSKEADIVDVKVLEDIEQILAQKKTAAKNDVVSLAAQEEYTDAPPMMGAKDGVDAFVSGIGITKQNSQIIQDIYGSDKTDLMTKEVAQSWADHMSSPDVSIDNKLGFIDAVVKAHPGEANVIFRQISDKNAPTFGFAAQLSLGGNQKAAKIALMGKGADVMLEKDVLINVKNKIGNAFGGYKSDVYNRNVRGITDYMKGLVLNGEDADNAKDIIEGSIGKIITYNNKDTVLPHNVSKKQFENWLDNIVIPGRPVLQKNIRNATDVFSNDYQFVFKSPGEYYIRTTNKGKAFFIQDSEDNTKPFVLKWGD